ncbi:MAG: methyl-accepting chemotaxis protein, partial [Gammaproteobacteria bacterium]|nr:methyl-accepting chemotaxis protein [Gammaproteobacteria bacterium]
NTDDAFKSIAESVVIISKLNTQIASAGEQQNLVVDEIQQNIVEINKVAEDTATGATSILERCRNVAAKSTQLEKLVDHFSV